MNRQTGDGKTIVHFGSPPGTTYTVSTPLIVTTSTGGSR